jgi:hypothetical protein
MPGSVQLARNKNKRVKKKRRAFIIGIYNPNDLYKIGPTKTK